MERTARLNTPIKMADNGIAHEALYGNEVSVLPLCMTYSCRSRHEARGTVDVQKARPMLYFKMLLLEINFCRPVPNVAQFYIKEYTIKTIYFCRLNKNNEMERHEGDIHRLTLKGTLNNITFG